LSSLSEEEAQSMDKGVDSPALLSMNKEAIGIV
jgi:hypothetical protein